MDNNNEIVVLHIQGGEKKASKEVVETGKEKEECLVEETGIAEKGDSEKGEEVLLKEGESSEVPEITIEKEKVDGEVHVDKGEEKLSNELDTITKEEVDVFTQCTIEVPVGNNQETPVPSQRSSKKHMSYPWSSLSREERLARAKELRKRYRESGEGSWEGYDPHVINFGIPLPQDGPRPKKLANNTKSYCEFNRTTS
ncbi:PREDICTED: uncharacterized protein LOC109587607 [Amphimedon queenslandica]|uniref:Uncharacterized protein n=1 Tax=Amphimedon queenslandica TaxID=400682 RepID=A0AAN0JRD5_AMPQE|nr:PREDICTED: uncharacterized protein LOC109587607 [Amphimedon queenslandica]|eukprot:XP_019859404.1 PREDICTED: uncharacterized protein LOC109587607 [Amphimedon queenslandica]